MSIELYPHQKKFLEMNPKRHLLAYDVGTGKTLTSIEWVKKNNLTNILVICPKTIKEQWEIELQTNNIVGTVCTKEYFRDKFDKEKSVGAVIVDEAHIVASTTSKLHKTLYKYLNDHRISYRLLLTATPVLSKGSMNVYALAKILGYDIEYHKWRMTFQTGVPLKTGSGIKTIWKDKTDQESKDKLIRYIKKIGTVVDKSEVYDVPEQREHTHIIQNTDETREAIKKEIDGETSHIARWTIVHRMQQQDKYDDVEIMVRKYARVILVSRYLDDIAYYKKLFPHADVLSGKTKDRGTLLRRLRTADKYILIVNSSISEGYNLPDTQAIIFSSLDFSFKNYYQMLGRAIRMDKPSETDIHIFTMKTGSDKDVYKSIKAKEDFHFDIKSNIVY